jgi:hypothetical protein
VTAAEIKETRGYCESQKRMTIADRTTTRRAKMARRKEIIIERNRIRRREPKNERNKGIRSRDVEQLLHLRKKRKSTNSIRGWNRRLQPRLETVSRNDVFGKTNGLGYGERAAGLPVALRKI